MLWCSSGRTACGRLGRKSVSRSTSFSYNAVGNRTNYRNGGDNSFTNDADDEPMGGVNTFTAGYDLNGDRTSKTFNGQVTNFGYDHDDQLTSLTKLGTTVSSVYDATGRQLGKTVNRALTIYYFGGNEVVEEKTTEARKATAFHFDNTPGLPLPSAASCRRTAEGRPLL